MNIITFEKFALNEGTWSIPNTQQKIDKLRVVLANLSSKDYTTVYMQMRNLGKDMYKVYGDDELHDNIDEVIIDTMNELAKEIEREEPVTVFTEIEHAVKKAAAGVRTAIIKRVGELVKSLKDEDNAKQFKDANVVKILQKISQMK